MKFNVIILTSLETRCDQSVSVGDTLSLMILLTLLVVAFTGQHFHFTHCSVESEVCLFVNFATDNRLLAISAISDVGVGVSTKNSEHL